MKVAFNDFVSITNWKIIFYSVSAISEELQTFRKKQLSILNPSSLFGPAAEQCFVLFPELKGGPD